MASEGDINDLSHLTDLVIVCCHAVYIGDGINTSEDQWLLQPFQRADPATGKPSETYTFINHIEAGAQHLLSNPNTLLIFSGGRTTSSPRPEAEGYLRIFNNLPSVTAAAASSPSSSWAKAAAAASIKARSRNEICATDSYQNLLFSIVCFREITRHYPAQITIITHAFKERRFLHLHAPAIKWPASRIRVQGINPPFTEAELLSTQQGEAARGFAPFEADPYGVRAPLAEKREKRNWRQEDLRVWNHLPGLEDEVKLLLRWEGGDSGKEIFPGTLPWEEAAAESS